MLPDGSTARPHIVLITCHDLGRHLGCYGVGAVHSPHLDGLAAQGARCTQMFCTSPGCSPSRATIATGRYPHSNGVLGLAHGAFAWDLNPDERHVAALLGEQGYATHLFGLQHVTPHAERLGFDRIHERGLGPAVAAQVAAFLRGPLPDAPLYLEINLEEPHRPYDQGGVQPDDSAGVFVPPYLPSIPAAVEDVAALQGAIRAADDAVGQILAALDGAGLTETALTVFTADHGVAMPRAKCTLYDPGLAVALLARWPAGGVAGGRIVDALLSNLDLLPTLLEAAGAPVPDRVQGRSFLPLLRGAGGAGREAIFAEKTFHSYYDPMRAIRTARYKFIRNFEAAFQVEVPGDVQVGPLYRAAVERYVSETHPDVELYDLAADPLEQDNLAGDPALAAARRGLDARLWAWMAQTDDPLLRGPIASPAYRRALAARSEGRGA